MKIIRIRKSQIQMGETIAVLFIFFLLLISGMVFYFKVQKGSIQQDIKEKSVLDAIDIAQKASYLPEMMCTVENVPMFETNCVDVFKAQAFHKMLYPELQIPQDPPDPMLKILYYDMFGYSHIFVSQIYPVVDPNPQPTYTIYENLKPGEEMTDNITTWIPVSMYSIDIQGHEQIAFGVLVVEVFS